MRDIDQHVARGRGRLAHAEPERYAPDQNADEIAVHDGTDRIVDHFEQQVVQDLPYSLWRIKGQICDVQHKCRREKHAHNNGDECGAESARKIQDDDWPEWRVSALAVRGKRGGYQHQYQHGRYRLQCLHEKCAEQHRSLRGVRPGECQHYACRDTDGDPQYQVATHEFAVDRIVGHFVPYEAEIFHATGRSWYQDHLSFIPLS